MDEWICLCVCVDKITLKKIKVVVDKNTHIKRKKERKKENILLSLCLLMRTNPSIYISLKYLSEDTIFILAKSGSIYKRGIKYVSNDWISLLKKETVRRKGK